MRARARRTGTRGLWPILVLLLVACGGASAPIPTTAGSASAVVSPGTSPGGTVGATTRTSQATPAASAARAAANAPPLATRATVGTPARTPTPATATWQPGGELGTGRAAHTATLLRDGTVLVVGGSVTPRPEADEPFPTATAERFDPGSGRWRPAGALATARAGHTATLLADGTVLVVGGTGADEGPLAAAERYDPVADRWLPAGALAIARSAHTATLLADGTVLVAGGEVRPPAADPDEEGEYATTATTERFDPAGGRWSAAPALATPREGHTATRLPSGEVLVVGGLDYAAGEVGDAARTAERFDPLTDAWRPAARLAADHHDHGAILLHDGTVLAIGGGDTREIERYDPARDRWRGAGRLSTTRAGPTATLLADGAVLIVGGHGAGFRALERAEVYRPATERTVIVAASRAPRGGHTATSLADGTVVVAGGWGDVVTGGAGGPLATAERLDTRLPLAASEPGLPLYRANFSRWPSALARGGYAAYNAPTNGYGIGVAAGDNTAVNPPEALAFGDFTLEVEAELLAGTDGEYGLTFREQRPRAGRAFGTFYLFVLSPAGEFALYFYDETGAFQTLQPPVFSAAILPGAGRNQLRVVCDGERISLAVNGKALGRYIGPSREAGRIGLVVSARDSASDAEVVYTDLRVTRER